MFLAYVFDGNLTVDTENKVSGIVERKFLNNDCANK